MSPYICNPLGLLSIINILNMASDPSLGLGFGSFEHIPIAVV
jgi:hypothetical protein